MVEIFDRELPDDCKKAITALKKLKVYFAMNDDTIDNLMRVLYPCTGYKGYMSRSRTQIRLSTYLSW